MKHLGVWLYAIQFLILGIGLMIYMNDFLSQHLHGGAIIAWLALLIYAIFFLYRLIKRIIFSYWAGEEVGRLYDRQQISGHM